MQSISRGRLGALALGCAAAIAGCRDDAVTTPEQQSGRLPVARPMLSTSNASDTTVTTFRTNPYGTARHTIASVHRITFPAASVCDPATSSYGPGTWDQPCEPATTKLTVTAKAWTDANGHPHIEFSPALRFVPGKEVILEMKDRKASVDPSAVILYCGPDGQCVDESASDPSLVTKRDAANEVVYRRIKHFSGYNVAIGRVLE